MVIRRLWFVPMAVGALVGVMLDSAPAFVLAAGATLLLLRLVARQAPWASLAAGSQRWQAREAVVIVAIAPGRVGRVQLGRERWRAECPLDVEVPAGSTVLVTGVTGTRLSVLPVEQEEKQ